MATYPVELQAVLQAQIDAANALITPRHSVNVTFSTPAGSAVRSPAAGRVVFAGTLGATGRTLVIEHGGGLKSLFYLLGSIKVSEGDYVTQGQTVATTQGHVVCDMRLGGAALDPWSVWRNVNPGVLFQ
nr:M23 family metallopeptidase [Gemmiger formicilis]